MFQFFPCLFSPIKPWGFSILPLPIHTPMSAITDISIIVTRQVLLLRGFHLLWWHGSPSLMLWSHHLPVWALCSQGKHGSMGVLPCIFSLEEKPKLNVVPSPVLLSDWCCVHLSFFLPAHPTCPFSPCQIFIRPEFYTRAQCVLEELETAAAETLFWVSLLQRWEVSDAALFPSGLSDDLSIRLTVIWHFRPLQQPCWADLGTRLTEVG